STAYDPLGDVAIAGNQDNNSVVQSAPGSDTWTSVHGGDGATQAVAVINPGQAGQAVYRYAQGNNFQSIARFTDNPDGTSSKKSIINLANPKTPDVALSGLADADLFSGFSPIPFAINAVDGRLLLGLNGLYETSEAGDIVSQQVGNVDTQHPITAL